MKTSILITAAAAALACSCTPSAPGLTLAEQAVLEYNSPIRPGKADGDKFWNKYSTKFIYAPAFDMPEVEGAVSYRFTAHWLDDVMYEDVYDGDTRVSSPEELRWWVKEGNPQFSFTARSPKADLSPIWNDIPVGNIALFVEGLDAEGNTIGISGGRLFLRDFPFTGRQVDTIPDYRTAAIRAMKCFLDLPQIQYWACGQGPDMQYSLNTYPAKIVSATLSMESLMAKCCPEIKDECMAVARNAADFLISISQKPDAPLAGFPPTYWGGLITSSFEENAGNTMAMEATCAAQAYLDLYDVCGDERYYRQALLIASTYRRLQRLDGSFPIKVDIATAEPVNEVCAMLHPIVELGTRLVDEYGLKEDYALMVKNARKWMETVAIPRFDMTGQFEDVSVLNRDSYQNLTNCTSATYASAILRNPEGISKAQLAQAEELIRLAEDQFTHWDCLRWQDGEKKFRTPCVVEQYCYRIPIDDSADNVANAFQDLYEATGGELCHQKALTLMDGVIAAQNPETGCMPTHWYEEYIYTAQNWINCTLCTAQTLLRFSEPDGEFGDWLKYTRRSF